MGSWRRPTDLLPGVRRPNRWAICRLRHAPTAITITLALLLAACAGGGDDGRATQAVSSPSGGWTVQAPAAKGELDSFTWALPYEAATLDPIKSWSYPENTILANLCESVVHLTPELKLEPGLASKVDTSDPKKVVLTVRNGVRFWDGSVMTAEDVGSASTGTFNRSWAATSVRSGATWTRLP